MSKGNYLGIETVYGIGEEVWCWDKQRNTMAGAISKLKVCKAKINMIGVHIREDRHDLYFDVVTDDGFHIEKELNGLFDTEIEAYVSAVDYLFKEYIEVAD